MMKIVYLKVLILAVFPQLLNAQHSIVVMDSLFSEPVPYVKIVSVSSGDILAVTNHVGYAQVSDRVPIQLERTGYQTKVISALADTIYMDIVWKELQEVSVKPVNKLQLYEAILAKSNASLAQSDTRLTGNYIESGMIVEVGTNDTLFFEKFCEMAIDRSVSKRKHKYHISAKNGSATQFNAGENDYLTSLQKDSKKLDVSLDIVSDLDTYFKYDLAKTKHLEKKGIDEKDVKRVVGSPLHYLLFNEGKDGTQFESHAKVYYRDSLLHSYESYFEHLKDDAEASAMANFVRTNMLLEYGGDDHYGLTSILAESVLEVKIGEKEYQIFVVKLFQPHAGTTLGEFNTIKNVDSFFHNVEIQQKRSSYYVFEPIHSGK